MMMKKTSEETTQNRTLFKRLTLVDYFLLLVAVVQGSSQLLEIFIPTAKYSRTSLLTVWLSLGNDISENWVAVSIFLTALVLGNALYRTLLKRNSSFGSSSTSIVLLFINLALCLRVYSNKSLAEKIQYLSAHLPTVFIISIIIFFVAVGIIIIKKERTNAEEIEKLSKGAHKNAPEESTVSPTGAQSAEELFQVRHPVSYAYRSFIKHLNAKKEIKRNHKLEMLQIKSNRKEEESKDNSKVPNESKNERNFGIISVCLALIVSIFLFAFLVRQRRNGSGIIFIEQITDLLLNMTKDLDKAQGPITNFLVSCGILFLIFLIFLVIFLMIYASARIALYLLFHFAEDNNEVHKISKRIKVFIFGLIEGALRPLMFIPDFLESLELMLLNTDVESQVDRIYPPHNPAPDVSDSKKDSK